MKHVGNVKARSLSRLDELDAHGRLPWRGTMLDREGERVSFTPRARAPLLTL
jgi:hypothetical protein